MLATGWPLSAAAVRNSRANSDPAGPPRVPHSNLYFALPCFSPYLVYSAQYRFARLILGV